MAHWSMAILLGLTLTLVPPDARADNAKPAGNLAAVARAELALLNAYRVHLGLRALRSEQRLTRAAEGYARLLAETDQMGHHVDGHNAADRILALGYRYCTWAENIFSEWSTQPKPAEDVALAVQTGWQHSPAHDTNMRNADASEVGIAFWSAVYGGRVVYKAVEVFGAPAGTCRTPK